MRSSIDLNVETRRKALTIIGSVICQSTHFKDLVLPMQFASHFEKGKDSDETSIKGLAVKILIFKNSFFKYILFTKFLKDTRESSRNFNSSSK